jgi:hypothetical protein
MEQTDNLERKKENENTVESALNFPS